MKDDVRITKTKRDLRGGLVSLLKKMPLDKITVCNICEEAMINRMTFYKHYMDKVDLLGDVVRDLRKKLVFSADGEFDSAKFEKNTKQYLGASVEYFAKACSDNRDALVAISRHDPKTIQEMVKQNASEFMDCAISGYGITRECRYDGDVVSEFMSSAVCGSVVSMLSKGDMSDKDIKSLKELFVEIFLSGIIFA